MTKKHMDNLEIGWETEKINCLNCGNDDSIILFSSNDRAYNLPGNFPIRRCLQCGLVYLSPRPAPNVLPKYYLQGSYFKLHNKTPKVCEINRICSKDRQSWLKHISYSIIQIWYKYDFGYRGLVLQFSRIIHFFLKSFLLKLSFFRLPNYIDNGKLLEIGFGEGENLKRFTKLGWNVSGADIDVDCCDYAKNILKVKVLEMNGPKILTQDNSFDVIYLSQTFEHLPDPVGSLIEYSRILKNNGQLIMEFPNFGCMQAKRWKSKWRGIEAPRHLGFYTKESVFKMIDATGYTDIKIISVNRSLFDIFLSNKPPTININSMYKNAWWNRRSIIFLFQLFSPFFGYGESLYVRARNNKPEIKL